MKNILSYNEFLNEGMNEANISFYKNVVQQAIKDALGHDVKQSDVKVGSKKQSGGYDMITLNGELLCSSSQHDEMLRWATNAIKEDPAKYGLKESVEAVNEANNLIYIKDKKFKSAQDIMDSFQKNAGPAWEKFLSDKMGIKAKAITGVSRRGDAVNISTKPIDKKDLGVFAHVFNEVTIEGVDGVISNQMVNNMQFEFSPAIFFRIDINYNLISGGSNGASIILPGSSTYNNMVMYDIVENRFLDQPEGKAAKAKYWVSGSW
jgi:hypothetical protein